MISTNNPLCKDCTSYATYGKKSDRKRLYCQYHAELSQEDYMNLQHTLCECGKQAYVNIKGSPPQYCWDCVPDEIKDVAIDIRNNSCEKCKKRAVFGYLSKKLLRCNKHKLPDMMRKSKTKCVTCKNRYAIWGPTTRLPKWCDDCVEDKSKSISLINKKCAGCNEIDLLDNTNKCFSCNPEGHVIVRKNAKELFIKNYLINQGYKEKEIPEEDGDFIHDKAFKNGKEIIDSRLRPDFWFPLETHNVILECDEFAHKDRPDECERNRLVNIYQATLFDKPMYVIRFNPDPFKVKGIKHDPNQPTRLAVLRQVLNNCLHEKNLTKGIHEFKLYYDEFDNQIVAEEIDLSKYGNNT